MFPDRVSWKPIDALVDHTVGRRGRMCVWTQREDAFPYLSRLPHPRLGKLGFSPSQSKTTRPGAVPGANVSALGQSEPPRTLGFRNRRSRRNPL